MSELNIYQNQPYPTEPMLNVSVEWVTQITENRAGKENRIPKITEPQYSIEGSDFALKDEDFTVFAQAFVDAEGKNNPFPFKCPLDYYCKAAGELYDTWSFQRGVLWAIDSLNYQIVKQYTVGGVSTFKTITLPVDGTIHIYEGGVEIFPSVNLSTGVVTFASPPSGGLTVDCEFRLPMRFDVDDNQLNQIKRAVNSIYSANDTSIYLAVNFRLLEDMNYARLSPLTIGGNLSYDFDGHPLSDIAYSDRSLTRIQSSDSLRETRDGLNVFRKKYAIANNNMNWVNTQKYFNLFMACKGRLLPFTFEGGLVRLDSDIFSVSMVGYGNVGEINSVLATHIFGTYLSKGGPSSGGVFICNGGCDIYLYWRTITPVTNFTGLSAISLVINNGQWYVENNGVLYQVDFIYGNNYINNDIGDNRGFPAGPFSPHGIGINYIPASDPCYANPNFNSPAYGDNLTATKFVTFEIYE